MTRALVALALAYAGLQVATEWIPPYELLHDELLREWRHFGIDLAPQLSTRADAPGD